MRNVIYVLSLLTCLALLVGGVSFKVLAAETKDLSKRLDELERKINRIDARDPESEGTVGTFLAEHISLGGFFEHAIVGNFSKDADYMLSAGSNILGINLGVKINDKFRFVSQELVVLTFPFTFEPDVTRRSFSNTPAIAALVAHAYGEYMPNEKFRLQMGLGWVPFGIMTANREFPLYLRRGGPQIASGGLTMPFAIWQGVHFLGTFDTNIGRVGYNLYSTTPTTDANMLGGGSRLWWSAPNDKIKIGTSAQILDWGTDTVFNVGADLDIKYKSFGVRTEYARSFTAGTDIWTAYVQPYFEFNDGKWVIHADADYANRPMQANDAATFLPFEKWELGGGVNYLPWHFLRARLLFLYHDYRGVSATTAGLTNDYYTVEYSTAIEF